MASTRFLSSLLGNSRLNSSRCSDTEPLAADASPLDELDERDVFWSTTTAISTDQATTTDFIAQHSYTPTAADFNPELKAAAPESSPPISTSAVSSVSSTASGHYFHPQTAAVSGLSAALATPDGSDDDRRRMSSPLIQRKKTAINPRLSPAGAAAVSTVVTARPYHYSSSGNALSRSAPVKVPIWRNTKGRQVSVMMGRFDEEESGDEDFDDDDDGSEMVPPHEMVARSQRTTTFSVFEGVGRTLKGRDLTRVRNAVMQKTGFLE